MSEDRDKARAARYRSKPRRVVLGAFIPYAMDGAHEVITDLWVGSRPSGLDAREHGFRLVVGCEMLDELHMPIQEGVRTFHAPFEDAEPSEAELGAAASAGSIVAEAVLAGSKVLVACYGGRNRSAFVAALAMQIILPDEPTGDIVEVIRGSRESAWGEPLSNQHFCAYLERIRP